MRLFNSTFVVEWLRVRIPQSHMNFFIQKDHEIWTKDHQKLPFFRGKQVWLSNTEPDVFQCVIYWESYRLWKSIEKQHLNRLYSTYNDAVGHIIKEHKQLTQGKQVYKIFQRYSNEIVLPQKVKVFRFGHLHNNNLQLISESLKSPLEVWQQKEPKPQYHLVLYPIANQDDICEITVKKILVGQKIEEAIKIMEIDKAKLC